MYQPAIKDDLIRKLYRYAKSKGQPMTLALDAILREFLNSVEIEENIAPSKKPAFCVVYMLKQRAE